MSPPTRLAFWRSSSAGLQGLREYALPEAGGEAFDLGLYPPRHVEGRAVGDVAVRPDRVLALRSARGVEEALLGEQDKGPLGVLSRATAASPAEISSSAPPRWTVPARRHSSLPGYRTVEREVHLEDAGAVAVALEGAPVALREVLARNGEELSRRNVEEDRPGPRYLSPSPPDARVDLTP